VRRVDNFDRIADGIQLAGWIIVPDFIEPQTLRGLRGECRELATGGALRKAAVGKDANRRIREEIRGDEIFWLDDAGTCGSRMQCLNHFEQLRLALNRRLQLGLFEFECHYARYAPGASYRRHYDRFHGDARRILSSVLYLNADWRSGDGGELRLHLDDAQCAHVDVSPTGGTLVLFLSERFAHEVLPARCERLSLTGWFRAR